MKKSTSPFENPNIGEGFQLEPGVIVKQRYRIEEKIGEGGCGTVFRATDTLQKNQLALKFLNPAVIVNRKKFLRVTREINLAQKITDERIVKVFYLDKWNSFYFLVMELVEGKSLNELFGEKKRFSWDEFKPIFFEILEGIRVLHQHKIIHRDIKPSNIIVSGQNKIKVLDFGLAKEISDKEKTSSPGEIVGSPYYMSPEQASGEELDFRSDIFSLGMILYRALTGKHPLEKYSTMEIIHNHMMNKPIKLALIERNIPAFIKLVIRKAVDKKERRFVSIGEMLHFSKKSRISVCNWLVSNFFLKPMRIVPALLLLIAFLSFIYLETITTQRIHSFEIRGSILIAKNDSDTVIWQKDFSPFMIKNAYIEPFKSYRNSTMVLLEHPQNNSFSPTVSLQSTELDSRIAYLDNNGDEIFNQSFIEATGMETHDFAKISKVENNNIKREDIDNDGKKEFTAMIRHSRGMYPTALFFLDEGELFAFTNPGSIDDFHLMQSDEKTLNFYVLGYNNVLAHLMFFSEININREKGGKRGMVNGFPNLNTANNNDFKYFYIFLPRGSSVTNSFENTWEKRGVLTLSNYRLGHRIPLRKDYSLDINGKEYHDSHRELKKVYSLINQSFRKRYLNNDLVEAYGLISGSLSYKVKNPFLISALLYTKGDLEILMGDYASGEKNLRKTIALHPSNNDAIHRLCEIDFLKGNPLKAVERLEDEFPNASNFWGLGRGHLLFKSYCYLQAGNFDKAGEYFSQIVDRTDKKSVKCFEGMEEIFIGNYQKATSDLEIFEKEFVYILTVLELRLLISRARLLAEKGLDRTRFYIDDILEFSKTKKHLATISAAYLQARDGSTPEAEKMARPAFEKLLQLSKGDFETRLWLFYDAYIYGKTMELCGNRSEAVRGYRECINANPHTDLARKSTTSLQRLNEL